MYEIAVGEPNYDAELATEHGRNTLRHHTSQSFAKAVRLGSHHPLIRVRKGGYGTPWLYTLLTSDNTIHRAPGVYSPQEQGPIERVKSDMRLEPISGMIRVEADSGDVLFVHQPVRDFHPSKEIADYHVGKWRDHVLSDLSLSPADAFLVHTSDERYSGVSTLDYRNGDLHIITVLPARAGHSLHSAVEGLPQGIPIVMANRAPTPHHKSENVGAHLATLALTPYP